MFVRADLPLAQQAVQAVHASIQASRVFLKPEDQHPNLVLLSVANERELLEARDKANSYGIFATTFYEEDIGDQPTAVATEPVAGKRRNAFRHYKLFDGTKFPELGLPPLGKSV